MSALTTLERRSFEELLEMSGGYVLDFHNDTFAGFFTESVGKDIYEDKYAKYGSSKAKRLRAFWELESDAIVGKTLSELIDIWAHKYPNCTDTQKATAEHCRRIAARLRGERGVNQDSLTEVTRRDIRRALTRESISWAGDLEETEFLNRLYDLSSMPSTDSRFENAAGDIWQHRVNNYDWDDQWVFSDERLQLANGPDEIFLNFLAEMVHPAVRSDREQAKKIVAMLNGLLTPDGWSLVEKATISGRPIYGPQRLTTSQHAINAAMSVAQVIDADYIHRQINRMTSALDSDPDLAIGTAKELVETCCQTILAARGKPATDKPDVLPLVRRALEELNLVPDGIADAQKGAKSIKSLLGNLATITQSLAELRNLYGTGHGKDGKMKGLSTRHARLAVGAATTLAVFLFDTHQERGGIS